MAAADDADPDYKLFLDQLVVDDRSYVLSLPLLRLKYEAPPTSDCGGGVCDEEYGIFLSHLGIVDGGGMICELGERTLRYESDCLISAKKVDDYNVLPDGDVADTESDVGRDITVVIDLTDDVADDGDVVRAGGNSVGLAVEAAEAEALEVFRDEEDSFTEFSLSDRAEMLGLSDLKSEGEVWPLEIVDRPSSSYKSRLIAALREPFDQQEYDRLMEMVTFRQPKTKKRILRSGEKVYSTGELSHSYFHHYVELAEQIKCVDLKKRLSLLRGFSFWLKNLGHDGSFKPWETAEYKLVYSQ